MTVGPERAMGGGPPLLPAIAVAAVCGTVMDVFAASQPALSNIFYDECPYTGACAAKPAPDDGVIPDVVDVTVADACGVLKKSGNAGWLDYDASGDEEVAVAERYVADQEPGAGPEGAEGQRVRLVVPGPPDEGVISPGSGCLAARS